MLQLRPLPHLHDVFLASTVPGSLTLLKLLAAIRMLTSVSELLLGKTFRPPTSSNTTHVPSAPLINSNNPPHRYHFPTLRACTVLRVQPCLLRSGWSPSSRSRTSTSFFLPARSLRAFWAFRLPVLSPLPLTWMILPIWTSPFAFEGPSWKKGAGTGASAVGWAPATSRSSRLHPRYATCPKSREMVSMRWVVAVDKWGTEDVGGIASGWRPESFAELRPARACEHSDGSRELEECQTTGDSRGKENVAEMRCWTELLHAFRGKRREGKMDAIDTVFDPLRDFAKDSVRLVKRCRKSDGKQFTKVAFRMTIGFVVIGCVGFFVKLIFIPINNIIVGSG
ncbi:hypothetical protein SLEP1_g56975 [Rubroshorea leprosula]|uniref:Uncharacterized protein n=1 Tax=Rubroshorea leprosula TaxID=152421 RepID=A0AAV5MLC5_9ROSI|nr:hypothetical protein SLEP1_g56975 [Rubroshorea leprosula]